MPKGRFTEGQELCTYTHKYCLTCDQAVCEMNQQTYQHESAGHRLMAFDNEAISSEPLMAKHE